jgi:choline dehydrogenase
LNAKPVISPNYLSTESDKRKAVESISIAREIFAQKPFEPHAVQEHLPGVEKKSFEELVKAAGGESHLISDYLDMYLLLCCNMPKL